MIQLKKIDSIDAAVAEMTVQVAERKVEIAEKLAQYVNGVVTEDTLDGWKKDRATLNKERTASEKERTGLEASWKDRLKPISDEYKAIKAEYDKAINNIDSQTAEFEKKRVEEKKTMIEKLFNEVTAPEGLEGWLTLAEIYDSKWENKTVKEKDIKQAITEARNKLSSDVLTIKLMNSEYEAEGLEVLKATKDIQRAFQKIAELNEQAKRIKEKLEREREEKERIEAEKAALERLKAQVVDEPVQLTFTDVEKVEPNNNEMLFGMPETMKKYKLTVVTDHLTDGELKDLLDTLLRVGCIVTESEVIE